MNSQRAASFDTRSHSPLKSPSRYAQPTPLNHDVVNLQLPGPTASVLGQKRPLNAPVAHTFLGAKSRKVGEQTHPHPLQLAHPSSFQVEIRDLTQPYAPRPGTPQSRPIRPLPVLPQSRTAVRPIARAPPTLQQIVRQPSFTVDPQPAQPLRNPVPLRRGHSFKVSLPPPEPQPAPLEYNRVEYERIQREQFEREQLERERGQRHERDQLVGQRTHTEQLERERGQREQSELACAQEEQLWRQHQADLERAQHEQLQAAQVQREEYEGQHAQHEQLERERAHLAQLEYRCQQEQRQQAEREQAEQERIQQQQVQWERQEIERARIQSEQVERERQAQRDHLRRELLERELLDDEMEEQLVQEELEEDTPPEHHAPSNTDAHMPDNDVDMGDDRSTVSGASQVPRPRSTVHRYSPPTAQPSPRPRISCARSPFHQEPPTTRSTRGDSPAASTGPETSQPAEAASTTPPPSPPKAPPYRIPSPEFSQDSTTRLPPETPSAQFMARLLQQGEQTNQLIQALVSENQLTDVKERLGSIKSSVKIVDDANDEEEPNDEENADADDELEAKNTKRRSRKSKKAPITEDPQLQPSLKDLRACIRKHLYILTDVTSMEELVEKNPPISDDEMRSFLDGDDDLLNCTVQNFRIDYIRSWQDNVFNQLARNVFVESFLAMYRSGNYHEFKIPKGLLEESIIAAALDNHMDYRRRQYREHFKPLSQEDADNLKRRKAMNTRRSTLHDSRVWVVLELELKQHRWLFTLLHPAHMSDDETDGEEKTHPPTFQIVKARWQSLAFRSFMWTLDTLYQERWAKPVGNRATSGNPPRTRIERPNGRCVDGLTPIGLWRNCYDRDWLASLRPHVRASLKVIDADYNFWLPKPRPATGSQTGVVA